MAATWLLCADISLWWGMRGISVRSSCSLSRCSDTVVSMSQYPQQAGAAGGSGVAAGCGGGPGTRGWGRFLPRPRGGVPEEDAGALYWFCPPVTAPPEEGLGQPRRPENPDTAEA